MYCREHDKEDKVRQTSVFRGCVAIWRDRSQDDGHDVAVVNFRHYFLEIKYRRLATRSTNDQIRSVDKSDVSVSYI